MKTDTTTPEGNRGNNTNSTLVKTRIFPGSGKIEEATIEVSQW
jgi:hypothetical protein